MSARECFFRQSSTCIASITALIPTTGYSDPWPGVPVNFSSSRQSPFWPTHGCRTGVGSAIRQSHGEKIFFSSRYRTPLLLRSLHRRQKQGRPVVLSPESTYRSHADRIAAQPPFISLEPRPQTYPLFMMPENRGMCPSLIKGRNHVDMATEKKRSQVPHRHQVTSPTRRTDNL